MKTDISYFEFQTFKELYDWLAINSQKEKEVYVKISRQKPENCIGVLSYYDAV